MTTARSISVQPYSNRYDAQGPAPDAERNTHHPAVPSGQEEAAEDSTEVQRDFHLLEGGNGRARPEDDELLSDLQAETADLREAAEDLEGKIRRAEELEEDPDARAELLEEADDLQADARSVSDRDELEELQERLDHLQTEFEEAKDEAEDFEEENPMPAERLVDYLRENGQREITQSRLDDILEDFDLDGEALNQLTLPLSDENAENVLGLLRRLDPNVDAAWESGSTPYSTDNIDKLKDLLGAIFPDSRPEVREREVIRLIDQNYEVRWNGASIKSRITENGWEGSRTIARRVFDYLDNAVSSGSDDAVAEAAERLGGWMGAGQEDWRKNDWNRTIASAIWTEAQQNPYLFRRLMKQIPDSVRREMVSVLRSNGGELEEFQAGDVWNSRDTASMIEWTLQTEDGPPPSLGPVDGGEIPSGSHRSGESPRSGSHSSSSGSSSSSNSSSDRDSED